nr:hypothetical protein [Tanacetum cinerariifolium]
MACNNSDILSAFDCNNARNALSNARMNSSVDVNDLYVFDDVSIRNSHVSKMPFNEVVSLLDKEKENLRIIESLKSKDVEIGVKSSEKVVSETENKSENDCQVTEKVCDREENPNVIAPGMFKLSVS